MKIPAKGASRFLSKEDLAGPIVATIARVGVETLKGNRGEEEHFILYFAEPNIKPLVFKPVNRKRVIAAYGDESDDWRGKPLEL
jgi:hypothetical protein